MEIGSVQVTFICLRLLDANVPVIVPESVVLPEDGSENVKAAEIVPEVSALLVPVIVAVMKLPMIRGEPRLILLFSPTLLKVRAGLKLASVTDTLDVINVTADAAVAHDATTANTAAAQTAAP